MGVVIITNKNQEVLRVAKRRNVSGDGANQETECMMKCSDVAKRLGIRRQTVRKLILRGDLGAIRVGKRGVYLISEEDLQAAIEEFPAKYKK